MNDDNQGVTDNEDSGNDTDNVIDNVEGCQPNSNGDIPSNVSEGQGDKQANADNASDNDSNDDDSTSDDNQSPEWFMKDKFKSMDEQAKAYHELQKKMGKFWGAPKDNYSLDGIEGISSDDPLVQNLMPALKELGLSQEGFSSLVKQYQQANITMMTKYAEDLKKELTENDVHNYQAVNAWMKDALSPEEVEQVQNNWLMTPEDFKLFNRLRLLAAPTTNVPSSGGDNAPKFESSKEVTNEKIKYKNELREGLRVRDKNYENELATRFRDARQRELRK